MKIKFLIITLTCLSTFTCLTTPIFADDFEIPHEIAPGDVISADVINETNAILKESLKSISSDDLIGTWSCDAVAKPYSDNDLCSGWETDGFFNTAVNIVMSFARPSPITSTNYLNLTTGPPSPFFWHTENVGNPNFYTCREFTTLCAIVQNMLIVDHTNYDTAVNFPENNDSKIYQIRKIGPNRISLTRPTFDSWYPFAITCDKQNVPPDHPTQLSASLSDSTVTMFWTDNSNDETDFKILRRDTLTGNYTEVGTTTADVETYDDTLTTAGTYWYRVKATNANGDSLGSNVVKVTISE